MAITSSSSVTFHSREYSPSLVEENDFFTVNIDAYSPEPFSTIKKFPYQTNLLVTSLVDGSSVNPICLEVAEKPRTKSKAFEKPGF